VGQVFNGIGMKYNRRKKIDTEGLGDDLKNHEEFYKNGKYTRKGRKALAGIHSIEEVQDNGAQYNIDTSTGKYHVIDPSIDKAIYSDLAQTGRHVFNNRILRDDTRVAVNAAQDGFTSDIESDEVIAMRVKNARTVIKNKKTEAANAELAAEKKNNKSVKDKDKEKEKDDKKEASVQGEEPDVEVKPVITVAAVEEKEDIKKAVKETKASKADGAGFLANKGKLSWPVPNGRVSRGYGKQQHPDHSGVFTYNNGVDILAAKGSNVQSVYKGVVSSVIIIPGAGKSVIIDHGSYKTVYSNLKEAYVTKGDKITSEQEIGSLLSRDGETMSKAHFEIIQTTAKGKIKNINPSTWLFS